MAFRSDPEGDQFFALRTFRRDGSASSTPVWLAPEGRHWYAYTPSRSRKVERIRRDPRVEVAPSTFEGDPTGPWRAGTARLLTTRERSRATRALAAKYGLRFRAFELAVLLASPRRRGGRGIGLEISLDDRAPERPTSDRFKDGAPGP